MGRVKIAGLRTERDDLDDYEAELATVDSTRLGINELGLYSGDVVFTGVGWGQSFGGVRLDQAIGRGPESYSVGSHYGMTHLMRIMEVVGGTWETLVGKRCYVLRRGPRFGATIAGIASLDGERVYILDELIEEVDRAYASLDDK